MKSMAEASDQVSRRRSSPGIGGGIFVALILLALLYGGLRVARRPRLVLRGTTAPAFTLERYGGGRVSLDQLRGKVVLLNFWATWCPPCVQEMPALVRLAHEYEPQGLVLLAVNRDDEQSAKAAVGIFVANRIPELASHVAFADASMSMSYRVQSLPTSYLIGRDGKVLDSYAGYLAEPTLRKKIEQVLQPRQ